MVRFILNSKVSASIFCKKEFGISLKPRKFCSFNSSGMFFLFSMVKYEIHLFESRTYSFTIALVGQASMQAVHEPQKSSRGSEYSNSQFVIMFAMKNQLPISLLITLVCLPIQPKPLLTAHALSITGPVSIYDIASNEGSFCLR